MPTKAEKGCTNHLFRNQRVTAMLRASYAVAMATTMRDQLNCQHLIEL